MKNVIAFQNHCGPKKKNAFLRSVAQSQIYDKLANSGKWGIPEASAKLRYFFFNHVFGLAKSVFLSWPVV